MTKLTVFFQLPEEFLTQLKNISGEFEVIVCTKRKKLKSYLPQWKLSATILTSTSAVRER